VIDLASAQFPFDGLTFLRRLLFLPRRLFGRLLLPLWLRLRLRRFRSNWRRRGLRLRRPDSHGRRLGLRLGRPDAFRSSPSLNLRPYLLRHGRLSLDLRLTLLRRPAALRLRLHALLLFSVTNRLRRALYLWLPLRLLLAPRLKLLLRRCAALLLVRDHLLPSSFPLRLLLLTKSVLRLHLLTHALALRLLGRDAIGALLFGLLSLQRLHLLPRRSVAASSLPRKVRHLFLPRLFSC